MWMVLLLFGRSVPGRFSFEQYPVGRGVKKPATPFQALHGAL